MADQAENRGIKLPLKTVMKIVRTGDRRTFNSFVKDAKIEIIPGNSPLSEVLFWEKDICLAMGVKTLPEKFLVSSEAAKILNIKESTVITLCKNDFLPHYRLGKNYHSRLLFIEQELADSLIPKISLERPLNYYSIAWRFEKFQELFLSLIQQARDNWSLSEKGHECLNTLLGGHGSIKDLAIKYDTSTQAVSAAFLRHFHWLEDSTGKMFAENKRLSQENADLVRSNNSLMEKLKALGVSTIPLSGEIPTNLFDVTLDELGLPTKAKKYLEALGVKSCGDVLNLKDTKFTAVPGYGSKTKEYVNNFIVSNRHLLHTASV